MALFVGLMSGTSLDGVDGVLAELDDGDLRPLHVRSHHHRPMPAPLRAELLALNAAGGSDELHRAALAANALSELYASVVGDLLHTAGCPAAEVRAIGAHGQTVRHRPGDFSGTGYTLQLINGAMLAEGAGIDVVCDFRSADVAAGGQGAPLVPAFHAACFGRSGSTVVLNVGGITNLSVLPAAGPVIGFDSGPGNVLLDLWCHEHLGQPFDEEGRWAASGQIQPALLALLLSEPYFSRSPPKSTGRDLFHRGWLLEKLAASATPFAPADVMATLLELTAQSAASALRSHAPEASRLMVCGGGAANRHLMARLAHHLPGMTVASTLSAGIPPDQVEALAFAWLAACRLQLRPANLPAVTGARGLRVLGAWYPAPR